VIARSIKEYVRTLVARAGLAGVHARVRLWQGENVGHLFTRTRAESFSAIYRNKAWRTDASNRSLSGPGSELARTETIRQQLPGLLEALGIRTLLDIGCGDWTWMKELMLPCDYVGIDIVDTVIRANTQLYGSDRVRFLCLDAVEDPLPESDAVLCRDVLFHLSFEDIHRVLAKVCASRARLLLATCDMRTAINADIISGDFRLLNLTRHPFMFPAPTAQIADNEMLPDRILGVWRVENVTRLVANRARSLAQHLSNS